MPDSMRGEQTYGADHYRPKKIFPALASAYPNLFYCCNNCNSRKGSYWPANDEASLRFIPNPCDHQMFSHLRFNHATVDARTPAGEFTRELLDLNDPDVVEYREDMLHMIEVCESRILESKATASMIMKKYDAGQISLADRDAALAKIEGYIAKTNSALFRLSGKT